jgi:hypothetical protein
LRTLSPDHLSWPHERKQKREKACVHDSTNVARPDEPGECLHYTPAGSLDETTRGTAETCPLTRSHELPQINVSASFGLEAHWDATPYPKMLAFCPSRGRTRFLSLIKRLLFDLLRTSAIWSFPSNLLNTYPSTQHVRSPRANVSIFCNGAPNQAATRREPRRSD